MKIITLLILIFFSLVSISQEIKTDSTNLVDTSNEKHLNTIVITASRVPESSFSSASSIEQIKSSDVSKMGASTNFAALANLKGIQMISPSLGFQVLNARGFSNTTNVRFAQLIDGIDNQAPHIGAPIANALGANDIDIDKIEIISGTSSALYGLNATNGMVNIRTKNPFKEPGISIQQLIGVHHLEQNASLNYFSQTNFRCAQVLAPKFALKINGSYNKGQDWEADDRTDLAAALNTSTGMFGRNNPAYDEVNSYGNESPNRKTLTLAGKKYIVSRTGYREKDIADYDLQNFKGDLGLYLCPKTNTELSILYKAATINTIYQRSNRFQLKNYNLQQLSVDYHSDKIQFRSYYTKENTGESYNLRSLAENLDKSYKSDQLWFADFTNAFNTAYSGGSTIANALQLARINADIGRYEPGSEAYESKKSELITINNWDYGAALRVKTGMFHSEGIISLDQVFPDIFSAIRIKALTGFDYRLYVIIPDGNYFSNPINPNKDILYSKWGGFLQAQKNLLKNTITLTAVVRIDKADYFHYKPNPRISITYSPTNNFIARVSYQSAYRFPSIFEGYSNVNSGGVKRVGGLKIMSDGIFENSYTKSSIENFQNQINYDINVNGLSQSQAIEKNKYLLKKNPYTYLKPEFVRTLEFGAREFFADKRMFVDMDFYYNVYSDFIAQMEASVPNTTIPDSIPLYLYQKNKQSRYRLWTNSKTQIYNYGASISLKYVITNTFSVIANYTFCKISKTQNQDGLEDGYNTPSSTLNISLLADNIINNSSASLTGHYQNQFEYVSFLVSGKVPSYWSLDAQISHSFVKTGIKIKIGATNMLNTKYTTMLGGPQIGGFYYVSLLWSTNYNYSSNKPQ